jgi:hypothetical protein
MWRRVPGLPFGEAKRVALVADRSGQREVWAAIDGALWSAGASSGARRVTLPNVAAGEGADRSRGRGVGRAVRGAAPLARVRTAVGEWRSVPLVLPPGAQPLRLAVQPGRLWLATDAGSSRRASERTLAARGGACRTHRGRRGRGRTGRARGGNRAGLLRRAAESDTPPVAAASARPAAPPAPRGDPSVAAVQRHAIAYVSLDPSRMRALWDAAGRRAWAPEVTVRGDYGGDRIARAATTRRSSRAKRTRSSTATASARAAIR